MDFTSTLPCSKLDRKSDNWTAHYPYWEALRRLAEGGQLMYQSAAQFLFPRSMEPPDVYQDRLKRFVYTNHFGNIKGWYTSALFKQPPTVVLRQTHDDGTLAPIDDSDPAKDELSGFQDNCDRAGRNLTQFWAELVQPKLLTYRQAYILFDLPTTPNGLLSKQAQQQAGALTPHLVAYSPQDIINSQVDEQSNLLWAVIKLRATTQDDITADIRVADRWYIFDRTQVAVYEHVLDSDELNRNTGPLANALGLSGIIGPDTYRETDIGTLLPGYPRPHALADQGRVPLFVQSVHPDHWIGQRIASPLLRLLNLENAHDWALEQSNLATLVIFSDNEVDKVRRGEAYFLQLGQSDKASFLEQSGEAFTASDTRLNGLREEIYRLAYLVPQGRSSSASAAMQSGYSKEQDMLPARDILAALGEQVRGAMQNILQAAADRMDLNVAVDVQGFDFLDRTDVTELEVLQKAVTIMDINSPTLERELAKRIVRIELPDANRELLQQLDEEINSNPTPTELQAQQQEKAQSLKLSMATKLASPRDFAIADNAA
jgi:hypothetical protein